MISIYLHELEFVPAVAEYWPTDICAHDQVDAICESSDGDYDPYAMFEAMIFFVAP